MRVLITGATGTVGGAVLNRLVCDPSIEVLAVVRKSTRLPVTVIQRMADLEEPGFVEALGGTEYDAIVHAAQPRDWSSDALGGDPFDLRVVRALDTLCSARTRRRIYTSGVWVYGNQSGDGVISERSALKPIVEIESDGVPRIASSIAFGGHTNAGTGLRR